MDRNWNWILEIQICTIWGSWVSVIIFQKIDEWNHLEEEHPDFSNFFSEFC